MLSIITIGSYLLVLKKFRINILFFAFCSPRKVSADWGSTELDYELKSSNDWVIYFYNKFGLRAELPPKFNGFITLFFMRRFWSYCYCLFIFGNDSP